MGTYGFTEIIMAYEENATKEEIENFLEELRTNQELNFKELDRETFELSSDRLQNLTYQEGIFNKIVVKHPCIYEAIGNTYVEGSSDIYYVKGGEQ